MAFLAIQAIAPAASADPLSAKRAEAARLTQQIERSGNQLEIAAEKVNNARIKANKLSAQLADAQTKMREADARASQIRSQLKEVAVSTYMHGGQPSAEANQGVDTVRADAYVHALAGNETDAIDAMRALKINMAQRRDELQKAKAAADAALAAVQADERAAEAADAAMRATLAKVKGDLAGLVAAEQTRLATRNKGVVPRAPKSPKSFGPIPGVSAGASAAVNYARAQIGKPYQWGGAGPNSYDCSGLTMMAWRAGGVSLPHSSQSQYSGTTHIPLSAVQPGDLIFYYSDIHHVGIYEGGGMIIAATHTGDYVREMSMYYTTPAGAGRPG